MATAVRRPLTPSADILGARLAEVARDIDHAEVLPADQLSALLYQVAALQNLLAVRLVRELQIVQPNTPARERDRLLTVAEAADRLSCSTDWLYRHHHRLPFAVRTGRHLRFSANGLEAYIRQRTGRERTSLLPDTEPHVCVRGGT